MRMRLASIALVLGLAPCFSASAQNGPDATAAAGDKDIIAALDAVCAKTACRPDTNLDLNLGREKMTLKFARSPYVDQEKYVYVYPGEMLMFHVELAGGRPGVPVFVRTMQPVTGDVAKLSDQERESFSRDPDNAPAMLQALADSKADMFMTDRLKSAPPGTLYVHYRQIPAGPGMVLDIGHNLGSLLKYDATISIPGRGGFRFEHSSTCALQSGLGVFETWPYALGPIMLENFRFLPGPDAVCE